METSKQRLIFLDILRAFAVFMMVQGHTIHAVLADSLRSDASIFYSIWHFMRGFTAPIFMFTAGTVFTFLLCKNRENFKTNPRVKKGMKRILTLFLIGYVLRYPSHRIFEFLNFTESQWAKFLAVDALHLIAAGLLLIIILRFITEKINVKMSYLAGGITLIIFLSNQIVQQISWNNILPLTFAQYLSSANGSQFPLFPWAGYMTAGALFGNLLSSNKIDYKNTAVIKSILSFGILMAMSSYLISEVEALFTPLDTNISHDTGLSFFRLGVVIILIGSIMGLARNLKSVPFFVQSLGKHSLVIYVVHLVLVYGASWLPGLSQIFGKSFNTIEAVSAATIMVVLMTLLGLALEKYGSRSQNYFVNFGSFIKRFRITIAE